MNNPDWFLIITEWKRKMGNVGVTLPFLVGSINHKRKILEIEEITAREIIKEIIQNPIDGYVVEVSQCPDISAPVFSIAKYNDKKNRVVCKSAFYPKNSEIESLVFSTNIHSRQGLNCIDKNECLEKLIEITEQYVTKQEYSRNRAEGKLGEYEYGYFSDREIKFVESTIMSEVNL